MDQRCACFLLHRLDLTTSDMVANGNYTGLQVRMSQVLSQVLVGCCRLQVNAIDSDLKEGNGNAVSVFPFLTIPAVN